MLGYREDVLSAMGHFRTHVSKLQTPDYHTATGQQRTGTEFLPPSEPIVDWNVGTSEGLGPFSIREGNNSGEITMDWNRVEGNWKQVKGKIKEQWGKLTDDDLDQINGKREQLEGKIQERYGYAKDQAKKDVDAWYDSQRFH